MILRRRIDGILLAPACSSADVAALIKIQGIDVVVLDRSGPIADVDIVRGDSIGGAYGLTRHLLELRHKRFMMLASPMYVSSSSERDTGFQQALQEPGLKLAQEDIVWGKFTQD